MLSIDDYDYPLPPELIANTPAKPRDAARLFVYDTANDTVAFDTFRNIGKYLPPGSLLIFNNTKVVPARLWLKKETLPARGKTEVGGGKIQVLLLLNELRPGDALVEGVVDRKLEVGAKLYFKGGEYLTAMRQNEERFFFRPSVSIRKLFALVEREGVTPIPPYIKRTPLSETRLRKEYQSVLAKRPASVAAPTASLHFTKRLLASLARRGITHTEVTLHVGAGTFAPIGEKELKTKTLFTEYYEVPAESARRIAEAKRAGWPVIPVGTTALRALESAARDETRRHAGKRRVGKLPTQRTSLSALRATELFIFPPYDFKIADGLVTNFHVPRSSLMLLVDAFLESRGAKRRILDLYKIAIAEKFRFFSFGDGMLIK